MSNNHIELNGITTQIIHVFIKCNTCDCTSRMNSLAFNNLL